MKRVLVIESGPAYEDFSSFSLSNFKKAYPILNQKDVDFWFNFFDRMSRRGETEDVVRREMLGFADKLNELDKSREYEVETILYPSSHMLFDLEPLGVAVVQTFPADGAGLPGLAYMMAERDVVLRPYRDIEDDFRRDFPKYGYSQDILLNLYNRIKADGLALHMLKMPVDQEAVESGDGVFGHHDSLLGLERVSDRYDVDSILKGNAGLSGGVQTDLFVLESPIGRSFYISQKIDDNHCKLMALSDMVVVGFAKDQPGEALRIAGDLPYETTRLKKQLAQARMEISQGRSVISDIPFHKDSYEASGEPLSKEWQETLDLVSVGKMFDLSKVSRFIDIYADRGGVDSLKRYGPNNSNAKLYGYVPAERSATGDNYLSLVRLSYPGGGSVLAKAFKIIKNR